MRLFAPRLGALALLGGVVQVYAVGGNTNTTNPNLSPRAPSKIRGVNLGGWLVLEPWITPSLFDGTGDARIVDEWTFGAYQPRAKALGALQKHWDTWITEGDFGDIAGAGLTHVRLPIGYWAFDVSEGEPYIQGQLPYLVKAVGWAGDHGLGVVIDLHGVPGSQNGFDNSGHKTNDPSWYKSSSNVERTVAVIKQITDRFKNNPAVVAIGVVNEPLGSLGGRMLDVTKQYYYESYGTIRQDGDKTVIISDAFQGLGYWRGFMPSSKFTNVLLDTHIYQMFSVQQNQFTHSQHISAACSEVSTLSASTLPILVGEWTPAATDCAKYLNGRGVGSRYDGTYPGTHRIGSCAGLTGFGSAFSSDYKTFLRQYWEAQVITYEKAGRGWMQWTWKTELAEEWSYQAGLIYGWIPQDPTDLKYPNICG